MTTQFVSYGLVLLLFSCTTEEDKPATTNPEFEQNTSQWNTVGNISWEEEILVSSIDTVYEADFRLVAQTGEQIWYSDPTFALPQTITDKHLQGIAIFSKVSFRSNWVHEQEIT